MQSEDNSTSKSPVAVQGAPTPGFLRRLFSIGIVRRGCILLGGVLIVIGLFYAEEDWRGKKAWERCRRDLESRGATLDWSKFIPPPVPDEKNAFKAPKMHEWFVKDAPGSKVSLLLRKLSPPPDRPKNQMGFLRIAELSIVPPGSKLDTNSVSGVLRFVGTNRTGKADQLLAAAVGPALVGPQSLIFLARPPEEIKPLSILVEATNVPTISEIKSLFSTNFSPAAMALRVENQALFTSRYHLVPGDTNLFYLSMGFPASCWAAADYLAWSAQAEPEFELMREALQRPFARMDGDYQKPFEAPVPNFVALRSVTQVLAQRAQCYLLVGQPDKALDELTMIHRLCRLVLEAPSHKSMTLVAVMIDAAITGMYTGVIADGLRLGAWREPQLTALQQQLSEINLVPYLVGAFELERAKTCHTLETTRPGEFNRLFSFGPQNSNLGQQIQDDPMSLFLWLMPRGWVYQNMAAIASLKQMMIGALDATNLVVKPSLAEKTIVEVQTRFARRSPHTFLAAVAIPNFIKAALTLSHNQTLAQEGLVACALERYRLARGQYPETLDLLVPGFISQLPHDLINGGALKYRRTGPGHFVLYSVGWNEIDDGGLPGRSFADGDWVWRGQEETPKRAIRSPK